MTAPIARVRVAGVLLDAVDLPAAAEHVLALVGTGRAHLVATLNVDQALHVRDDPRVAAAFDLASLRVADGAPVVALSRLLGRPLPGRVTGADLLPAVCARAARDGRRVAIVGGRPGVGDEAARRLIGRWPALQVVAVLAPPLGFEDDPEQDDAVVRVLEQARPDVVFVCLGCPKQELWVAERLHRLPFAVYLGVGAAVDFAAGTVRRAPAVLQRAGLEWAWRLGQERRRLAHRYLVRGPRFLTLIAEDLRAARRAS